MGAAAAIAAIVVAVEALYCPQRWRHPVILQVLDDLHGVL
jgi:hypothetical protein